MPLLTPGSRSPPICEFIPREHNTGRSSVGNPSMKARNRLQSLDRSRRLMKKSPSVLDPAFRYRPSFATDLRKTIERARREQQSRERQHEAREVTDANVLPTKAA